MKIEEFPAHGDWDSSNWRAVLPDTAYAACDVQHVHGAEVEPITAERVARVDRWHAWTGDYAECSVTALVELTDGTWAGLVGWCDTTGWDCQAGVDWRVAPTRDEAIRLSLDAASRRLLDLALPGEEIAAAPSGGPTGGTPND